MEVIIYAKRPQNLLKKRDENPVLNKLIELTARKYQAVFSNVLSGEKVVLFDSKHKRFNKKATLIFIAKYTSIFVKQIPSEINSCVGKYVSKRQITRLINNNSCYTSIHSISILISILSLLALDEKSDDFLSLSCADTQNDPLTRTAIINQQNDLDIAKTFLEKQITDLLNDHYYNTYTPFSGEICEYIVTCYDYLMQMTNRQNAFNAIGLFFNNHGSFILPRDMPHIPKLSLL